MAQQVKSSKIWDYLLIFALVYLGSQLIFKYVFPSKDAPTAAQSIVLSMEHGSVRQGNAIAAIVQNKGTAPITLKSNCPSAPLRLYRVEGSGSVQELRGGAGSGCVLTPIVIEPGDKQKVDLSPWKYSTLGAAGMYEVRLPEGLQTGTGAIQAASLEITEPGVFTKLFRAVITKPFLNFLILIASLLPDHNLGVGIIILTLLVKILLFIPTQHALEGQKKMQLLQPKVEALKKQYGSDPAKLNQETMKLWKEMGVNPLQSCLPMLVQFPVLIGLFYVIRDGSDLALSTHLIYPAYQHIGWGFNHYFLGLDLTQPSVYLFPPLLVILQFLQMKLSFAIAKKKSAASSQKVDPTKQSASDMQQKIMTYFLPLMIGFFALRFPSAVSLYWGVSTVFAIGQQILVNREHLKV